MSALEAKRVIARNFPWNVCYDVSSFTSQMHEDSVWNQPEYQLLEKALLQLTLEATASDELIWRIFRIFSYCFASFGSHLDPRDSFQIEGISPDEFYDLRERFQNVFEGYFSRNMQSSN